MTNEEAQIVIGNIPLKPEVLDDCYSITEYQEAKAMAIKALEQGPKTGRWIRTTVKPGCFVYGCDNCGYQQTHATNFCPDCGIRMYGVEENAESEE